MNSVVDLDEELLEGARLEPGAFVDFENAAFFFAGFCIIMFKCSDACLGGTHRLHLFFL